MKRRKAIASGNKEEADDIKFIIDQRSKSFFGNIMFNHLAYDEVMSASDEELSSRYEDAVSKVDYYLK